MKILLLVLLAASVTGCASIVQSGPDRIKVTSEPAGARVYLNDIQVGTTPVMLTSVRSEECIIRVEKDGYETGINDNSKVVAGWFFGNLLLGPGALLGLGIDLIGHNQGKHSESAQHFFLKPVPAKAAMQSDQPEVASAHASTVLPQK